MWLAVTLWGAAQIQNAPVLPESSSGQCCFSQVRKSSGLEDTSVLPVLGISKNPSFANMGTGNILTC